MSIGTSLVLAKDPYREKKKTPPLRTTRSTVFVWLDRSEFVRDGMTARGDEKAKAPARGRWRVSQRGTSCPRLRSGSACGAAYAGRRLGAVALDLQESRSTVPRRSFRPADPDRTISHFHYYLGRGAHEHTSKEAQRRSAAPSNPENVNERLRASDRSCQFRAGDERMRQEASAKGKRGSQTTIESRVARRLGRSSPDQ
jgi:hypothetical protein